MHLSRLAHLALTSSPSSSHRRTHLVRIGPPYSPRGAVQKQLLIGYYTFRPFPSLPPSPSSLEIEPLCFSLRTLGSTLSLPAVSLYPLYSTLPSHAVLSFNGPRFLFCKRLSSPSLPRGPVTGERDFSRERCRASCKSRAFFPFPLAFPFRLPEDRLSTKSRHHPAFTDHHHPAELTVRSPRLGPLNSEVDGRPITFRSRCHSRYGPGDGVR